MLQRLTRLIGCLGCVLATASLEGCSTFLREAAVPIPLQVDMTHCAMETRSLIVILPGRAMPVRQLEAHGFVQAVRSLRLNADVIRADAHSAYYIEETVVERLRRDVIAPAQAAGYSSIWLAGISLGGLGAVLYADAHPRDVAGLFLISPYLGNPSVAQSIAREGGLKRWHVPDEAPFGLARETHAWRSIRDLSQKGRGQLPIYLGYGLQDWNAPVAQVFAEALPPEDVFTSAGRHDWEPWFALWKRMLAASNLQRC